MKKSSLVTALLFLAGVLIGGTAVFFFVKSPGAPSHTSEPVKPLPLETGTAGDIPTDQLPPHLEEADEIPPPPGAAHTADEAAGPGGESAPTDEDSIPAE